MRAADAAPTFVLSSRLFMYAALVRFRIAASGTGLRMLAPPFRALV
jgi:hypothetical protein